MFSDTTKSTVLTNLEQYNKEYNEATPFPYAVLDNFLDSDTLNECLSSIEDNAPTMNWLEDEHWAQRNKRWIQDCTAMPHNLAKVIWWLNSSPMLSFVENLTGINSLIPDVNNEGGGLHYSSSGGKLNVHVDFNIHRKLGLKRRINALLFLNKDWEDAWEGNLELWRTDRSQCEVEVKPIFNRLAVFNTNSNSYHGVSKGIFCPEDKHRISIAMYYYTFEDEEKLSDEEKRTTALFYK